jgi:hypothetical protein
MRSGVLAWCVLSVGCGPQVLAPEPGHGKEDDAGTTDAPVGTSTSSTTSTSTTTGTPGTTVADDTSSDSTAATGWVDFIMPPDGDSETIECDLWEDDCPRGEKCMPYSADGSPTWNGTRCSPIADDPGAPGDPCTVEGSGVSGIDDCEKGSMCWDVDPDTLMGVCVAFCTGSPNNPVCDDPTTTCRLASEGVLILCLPSCDPLVQDCPGGEPCVPVDDDFICTPEGEGEGQNGEPCEYLNACAAGLACIPADAVPGCEAIGCCSPFCAVDDSDPPCTLEGQVCVPWFEPGQAPPEHENVGVCAVPQ